MYVIFVCIYYFHAGFKISEISADISAIFRVSVNIDTIYPSDISFNGNFEIFLYLSAIFRRYIGILPIFRDISRYIGTVHGVGTVHEQYISGHCSLFHKNCCLGGSNPAQN